MKIKEYFFNEELSKIKNPNEEEKEEMMKYRRRQLALLTVISGITFYFLVFFSQYIFR